MQTHELLTEGVIIQSSKDWKYVAYFDADHEGGETVEICGFKQFAEGYGYPKEELDKILSLKVGECVHFISHPIISMCHHFIMRVK